MEETQPAAKVEETATPAQAQTTQEAQAAPQSEETPQSIDWRKWKEARKVERQQKEAAEKTAVEEKARGDALKAALEALVNKPQASDQGQTEDTEDSRIQKKIDAALANERKRVEDERRQREQAEFPQKLAQAYPDFDNVCSSDNLDYLEYHYPEVASGFKHAPDSFDKWSNIYKAVKRFIPNNVTDKQQQKKAEKNGSKPQSMAIAGVAQTGDTAPMMLNEQRKADNWQRMQKRMKGIA